MRQDFSALDGLLVKRGSAVEDPILEELMV